MAGGRGGGVRCETRGSARVIMSVRCLIIAAKLIGDAISSLAYTHRSGAAEEISGPVP
jgi:hypothetical protein